MPVQINYVRYELKLDEFTYMHVSVAEGGISTVAERMGNKC